MSTPNDGGSAFPVSRSPGDLWKDGMALRDYFAAKAMAALICDEPADSQFKALAKVSYQVAAAMLAERAKQK